MSDRIAALLRDALSDRALSYRAAERATGVPRSTLQAIASGGRVNIADARVQTTLQQIAARLDLGGNYFALTPEEVAAAIAGLSPLGAYIRRARLTRGLSQPAAGVAQSTISRIETDPNYTPTVPVLLRIAQELGVDVGDLKELCCAPTT